MHGFFLPWVTIRDFSYTADHKFSLFKNSSIIKFEGLVHEQAVESLRKNHYPFGSLNTPIFHYPSTGNQENKNIFYRSLLDMSLEKDPFNPRVNFFMAQEILASRGSLQTYLETLLNGVKGGVREWPLESIQNLFAVAQILLPTKPKASLDLLLKATEVIRVFKEDAELLLSQKVLLGINGLLYKMK